MEYCAKMLTLVSGAIIFSIMQMIDKSILFRCVLGMLLLSACSPAGESTVPITITIPPAATATQVRILPTASSPQDSIVWQNLELTLAEDEITDVFVTEFGVTRIPSPGEKFTWVHLQLKNVGPVEMDIPIIEHFSLLYAAVEIKPTYGHRQDHTDFSSLDPTLFPDQNIDGWLRFDIPVTAELSDLRFVFLPESAQVGASYGSPNFPYADDKPTYVWTCSP